jgi:CHAD domain-containing protein
LYQTPGEPAVPKRLRAGLPSLLSALLKSRLASLAKHLPDAIRGNVEAIHQARVASRRLREVLPLLGTTTESRQVRIATRSVRSVTRALGPVRELDVTLQVLQQLAGERADLAPAARLLRRVVVKERKRHREAMLKRLDQNAVEEARRPLRKLLKNLPEADDDRWRRLLASRALQQAAALAQAIEIAGLLFDPLRLHEVRIAVKKLRYTLELSTEARTATAARFVETLRQVQNQLGVLHDLQVLLGFARAPELAAVAEAQKALAALREMAERKCRREHAWYVKRRPRVLAICEAILYTPPQIR